MADYPKSATDPAGISDRVSPHLERKPDYKPAYGGGRVPVRNTGRPRTGR